MDVLYCHEDDTIVEPFDLLGDVSLHSANGQSMIGQRVMIDSFLIALGNGLCLLHTQTEVSVELVDEGAQLDFRRDGGRFSLRFQGSELGFDDLFAAKAGTAMALNRLIDEVQALQGSVDRVGLRILREACARLQPGGSALLN